MSLKVHKYDNLTYFVTFYVNNGRIIKIVYVLLAGNIAIYGQSVPLFVEIKGKRTNCPAIL